ncbi:hypothetical protein J2T13_000741 [Paenibacillus sp. DS2015]
MKSTKIIPVEAPSTDGHTGGATATGAVCVTGGQHAW